MPTLLSYGSLEKTIFRIFCDDPRTFCIFHINTVLIAFLPSSQKVNGSTESNSTSVDEVDVILSMNTCQVYQSAKVSEIVSSVFLKARGSGPSVRWIGSVIGWNNIIDNITVATCYYALLDIQINLHLPIFENCQK